MILAQLLDDVSVWAVGWTLWQGRRGSVGADTQYNLIRQSNYDMLLNTGSQIMTIYS